MQQQTWDLLAWASGLVSACDKQVALVLLGAGVLLGYNVISNLDTRRKRAETKRKRRERQDQVLAAFEELENSLKDVDEDSVTSLTSMTLLELRELLDKRSITSSELLKAYQVKALRAHKRTRCLVEPIKEALSDAESKDKTDRDEGLLYGIPVSIKDDVGIKGYNTTAGASCYIGQLAPDDSALVKVLREHGAVPFVRSNECQLGMSTTSGNPLYGPVFNSQDLGRSPGGSSSGEGALVGCGGSVLGYGSDIGGSIRIPAHYNGVCGFKPTSTRIGHYGMPEMKGEDVTPVPTSWGPLARDVGTVVIGTRALWQDGGLNKHDALVSAAPFNEQAYITLTNPEHKMMGNLKGCQVEVYKSKRPLKIGYYEQIGQVAPLPVTRRAVQMARSHLEHLGHQVVDWNVPDADEGYELLLRGILADGGELVKEALKYDEVDPSLAPLMKMIDKPYLVRWLLSWILVPFDPMAAKKFDCALGLWTALGLYDLLVKLQTYRRKVAESWLSEGIDAVICPVLPFPALPLDVAAQIGLDSAAYTGTYNVLDYPAGVVPMTRVTSQDDVDMKTSYPSDKQIHKDIIKAMEDAVGLPVGVQVVGRYCHDEMVLRVMKEVEGASDLSH